MLRCMIARQINNNMCMATDWEDDNWVNMGRRLQQEYKDQEKVDELLRQRNKKFFIELQDLYKPENIFLYNKGQWFHSYGDYYGGRTCFKTIDKAIKDHKFDYLFYEKWELFLEEKGWQTLREGEKTIHRDLKAYGVYSDFLNLIPLFKVIPATYSYVRFNLRKQKIRVTNKQNLFNGVLNKYFKYEIKEKRFSEKAYEFIKNELSPSEYQEFLNMRKEKEENQR